MSSVTVTRWGNSLGLRLPKALAKQVDIRAGQQMELAVEDGAIVARPVTRRRKYTLRELCAGMTSKNSHPEVNWGPPAGSELI